MRCFLKLLTVAAEVTVDGKLFQMRAAAVANADKPVHTVDWQ